MGSVAGLVGPKPRSLARVTAGTDPDEAAVGIRGPRAAAVLLASTAGLTLGIVLGPCRLAALLAISTAVGLAAFTPGQRPGATRVRLGAVAIGFLAAGLALAPTGTSGPASLEPRLVRCQGTVRARSDPQHPQASDL